MFRYLQLKYDEYNVACTQKRRAFGIFSKRNQWKELEVLLWMLSKKKNSLKYLQLVVLNLLIGYLQMMALTGGCSKQKFFVKAIIQHKFP